jgi:hypothetical protein
MKRKRRESWYRRHRRVREKVLAKIAEDAFAEPQYIVFTDNGKKRRTFTVKGRDLKGNRIEESIDIESDELSQGIIGQEVCGTITSNERFSVIEEVVVEPDEVPTVEVSFEQAP